MVRTNDVRLLPYNILERAMKNDNERNDRAAASHCNMDVTYNNTINQSAIAINRTV
jgi:hypothetical protein